MPDESKIKLSWRNEILIAQYISDEPIDEEMARFMVKKRLEFAEGKPHKLISAFPRIGGMTKEARDYFSTDEAKKDVTALAMVTESKVGTMIANIFMSFNLKRKPIDAPVKLFNKMEQAFEWINKQ